MGVGIPPKPGATVTEDQMDQAATWLRDKYGITDEINDAARAARIDELGRWVERIGDRDTISELLSNELRTRIAELEGQ